MPTPAVSVTICMHNASRYICETLDSVFAQTLQDFEIIVVDDGSTDGSVDLIERRYRDRRLTIIRQRQQTLRIARPVSLAHAKGTYFAILDGDDLWSPIKLERQVEAARAAPGTGLVFSDCELIDDERRDHRPALGPVSLPVDRSQVRARPPRAAAPGQLRGHLDGVGARGRGTTPRRLQLLLSICQRL